MLIFSPGFPVTFNGIVKLFFMSLYVPAVNGRHKHKLSSSTQFHALTLHTDVYNCMLKER